MKPLTKKSFIGLVSHLGSWQSDSNFQAMVCSSENAIGPFSRLKPIEVFMALQTAVSVEKALLLSRSIVNYSKVLCTALKSFCLNSKRETQLEKFGSFSPENLQTLFLLPNNTSVKLS